MSWLDFANYFLSNQRLHAWSWINRTFSWEWCFLVETLALSVLGLFLFCFCLVWGEQVTDAQDFGWQSKGEDHFRSWFPFSCLLGDNSVLFRYCLVQRPFWMFLLFSSDPWSGIFFPFFAFSHSLIGNFSFFFFFFFCFPRARIDILTLGQGLW